MWFSDEVESLEAVRGPPVTEASGSLLVSTSFRLSTAPPAGTVSLVVARRFGEAVWEPSGVRKPGRLEVLRIGGGDGHRKLEMAKTEGGIWSVESTYSDATADGCLSRGFWGPAEPADGDLSSSWGSEAMDC